MAKTKGLWAPIAKPERGKEWILWSYVAGTRRGAKDGYVRDVLPARLKAHLARVRFAKVFIEEEK